MMFLCPILRYPTSVFTQTGFFAKCEYLALLTLRLVLAALGSAPASADRFGAVSWSSRVRRMAGRGATGAAGTACASWTLDHGVVKIWHTDLPTATVHEPYRITACKDAPDCRNPPSPRRLSRHRTRRHGTMARQQKPSPHPGRDLRYREDPRQWPPRQ